MNVYTASGASLFESLEPAGHFSVPATESGSHRICLHNAPNASNTEHAILTIRAALEVEDHSELAKREHVEAVQAELDRMEKMAVHVYEEMVYMRSRCASPNPPPSPPSSEKKAVRVYEEVVCTCSR